MSAEMLANNAALADFGPRQHFLSEECRAITSILQSTLAPTDIDNFT